MGSSDMLTLPIFVLGLILLHIFLRYVTSPSKLPLPPGPRPFPILGNLLDIPFADEHNVYAEWAKKYGDVIHVNPPGKHIVILNSFEAAKDLLDGRSAIYSDRPVIPMLHDCRLMDMNWAFTFTRYSPEWRRHRRLFMRHLGPTAPQIANLVAQKAAAHRLLRSMLHEPDGFVGQLKNAAAEIILRVTYGYQIESHSDPLVVLVEYVVHTVGEAVLPGRFLVNVLPILKYLPEWFPGTGFKTWARKSREAHQKHLEGPFLHAKQKVDQGIAPPSFVTSALTEEFSDDLISDIKAVAGTMYGAGAETTSSTMHYFILALVLHPGVQERAQKELDSVLGHVSSPTFRLPTFEDRPYLPYIDAVVKESLRWFPTLPSGIPHCATEDDVYRGWRIPKGSIVIHNAWSMLQDEQTYPAPSAFRPERFLGENPAPHPGSRGCFGFGRRECPGRNLAEASLWIQIASILAVFAISPAIDKDGRVIDVRYARETLSSLVKSPQDFPCTITPRSEEAQMRIRETLLEGDEG